MLPHGVCLPRAYLPTRTSYPRPSRGGTLIISYDTAAHQFCCTPLYLSRCFNSDKRGCHQNDSLADGYWLRSPIQTTCSRNTHAHTTHWTRGTAMGRGFHNLHAVIAFADDDATAPTKVLKEPEIKEGCSSCFKGFEGGRWSSADLLS